MTLAEESSSDTVKEPEQKTMPKQIVDRRIKTALNEHASLISSDSQETGNTVKHQTRHLVDKTQKRHIKTAKVKSKVHVAMSKQQVAKSKLALNKLHHAAKVNKSVAALKSPLKKSRHKVASKKKVTKVNVALI